MERHSNPPNEVLNALRNIIVKYLHRRRAIVGELLIHYRPHLIKGFNLVDEFGVKNIEKHCDYFDNHYRDDANHFSGVWQNEWEYNLHGIGCEMTHRETGEHFAWDITHPKMFSTFEILKYYTWFETMYSNDNQVEIIKRWFVKLTIEILEQLLDKLLKQGVLRNEQDTWKYLL